MANGNSSCCLFCASSSTPRSLMFEKSKGTIKEQFEVIVILRDILGLEEGKLDQFRGKLHSNHGIRVCESCRESVIRCVEAVREIAKLQNRIATISDNLKGQIYDTWMEEGEGDSLWGQIRLEVLDLKEIRGQEDEDKNFYVDNAEDSNSSDGDGVSIQNSFSGENLDTSGTPDNDISVDFVEGGQEHSIFNDPSLEVEKKVIVQTMTEESSSIVPVITGIYGSVLPQMPENSNSMEKVAADVHKKPRKHQPLTTNETDSDESMAGSFFQCPLCPKSFVQKSSLERHKRTHSQRYACKTCGRSYAYVWDFKKHLRDNVCQRPKLRGRPKFLRRKKTSGKRKPLPKTPCKYCGLEFANRKRHERICRTMRKPDDSWKQHLQLESINDVKMDEEEQSDDS